LVVLCKFLFLSEVGRLVDVIAGVITDTDADPTDTDGDGDGDRDDGR
jgi:hypothetical protein